MESLAGTLGAEVHGSGRPGDGLSRGAARSRILRPATSRTAGLCRGDQGIRRAHTVARAVARQLAARVEGGDIDVCAFSRLAADVTYIGSAPVSTCRWETGAPARGARRLRPASGSQRGASRRSCTPGRRQPLGAPCIEPGCHPVWRRADHGRGPPSSGRSRPGDLDRWNGGARLRTSTAHPRCRR